MVSYGFRLFAVSLRKRDGRKDEAFFEKASDGKPAWRFSEYLTKLLEERIDERHQGFPHNPIDLDDITDLDARDLAEQKEGARARRKAVSPVFYLTDVKKLGANVTFSVRYGSPANHDMATSVDDPAEDKSISGLPPTRVYQGCLIVPETENSKDVGILAIESVGRACPHAYFQRWARWWASETSRVEHEASENSTSPDWWKMMLQPVTDDKTFMDYIDRADATEIQLMYQDADSSADMKLTAEVKTQKAKRQLKKLVKEWRKAMSNGGAYSKPAAAGEIAAFFGDEVEALKFDDVSIHLEDDEYGSKTLGPYNLSDVFTYRYSKSAVPDPDQFKAVVRGAVERLNIQHKPQYDWTEWPVGRR